MKLTRQMIFDQNLIDRYGVCVIPKNITKIDKYAFSNNVILKSIIIPNHVRSIGYGAFAECKSLENVKLPKRIIKINAGVFNRCTSLKNINIPNSVKQIKFSAFEGCISLKSINIPENTSKIGKDAFKNCSSLESVIIPKHISKISCSAFKNCNNLKPLNVGKILLDEVIKSNTFDVGLCNQFDKIISELKLPTCFKNELPCFTNENAIKYCNGKNEPFWFTEPKDRERFVYWMLEQMDE